tara:strand:- start:381 stop:1088 length:708 start_codon:yes stop_codon:yes gene_type:complete
MVEQSFLKLFWGICLKLLPYVLVALGLKLLIWTFESFSWWPEINNPGIIIGVIGFGIAILLGAKLSVVNGRLYSIEDAVCRIVGSLRVLHHKEHLGKATLAWAIQFEETLSNLTPEHIIAARQQTTTLIAKTLDEGHDGPHLAGFTRDVSYVLHRATAEIPMAYEVFLTLTIALYTIMIAVLVPSVGGFIAIFILVFVLFGAAMLIEDMDHPLDKQGLIAVNIEPLKYFISQSSD